MTTPSRGANRLQKGELTGEELRRLRFVCPSFVPGQHAAVNYKVILSFGTTSNGPAVAKVLRKTSGHLVDRFAVEVQVYRSFAGTPPPFQVPLLRAADISAGVLVLSQVDGEPVTLDRYPSRADLSTVERVIAVADLLQEWGPPEGPWPRRPLPVELISRHVERGVLSAAESEPLQAAARGLASSLTLSHGDLLFQNVFIGPDGSVTIIDWEHAGWRFPHYDLAMLWSTLGDVPEARELIEARVMSRGAEAVLAFWSTRRYAIFKRSGSPRRSIGQTVGRHASPCSVTTSSG